MVWAHQPYGAVLERMSWLTDVLPSFNGAEQRRALRAAPRRSFEFDVMMSAAERRAAENRLHPLRPAPRLCHATQRRVTSKSAASWRWC
jgi:hypothetical protein